MDAFNLTALLEDIIDSSYGFLAVPVALFTAIFKVVAILLHIATFPMRVFQFIGRNYPILTLILLSILVLTFFVVRRITRQSLVSYFLYIIVPYCISLAYTIFGFVFPQVHTISRVIQFFLHPIRWLLGMAEQVDRRARPIRQVVEVFSPSGQTRGATRSGRRESTYSVISSAEKANDERIQCCICIFNEKTVFLRPCNHICLCEGCFRAVMNEDLPRCPICRATIESHINVFL